MQHNGVLSCYCAAQSYVRHFEQLNCIREAYIFRHNSISRLPASVQHCKLIEFHQNTVLAVYDSV